MFAAAAHAKVSPSVLMHIQPTILRFAQMLASVLKLEVEIVDADLVRVAGTGSFGEGFGQKLNSSSLLLKSVIETQREKVVIHSRFDPSCKACAIKDNCPEKAFLGIPILVDDQCLGVISLVALTPEQQGIIKDNVQALSDYVRHISALFVARLLPSSEDHEASDDFFLQLVGHLEQGVLIIDPKNRLRFVNEEALHLLGQSRKTLEKAVIQIEPFLQEMLLPETRSSYVLHIGGEISKRIFGKRLDIHNRSVFLMSQKQNPPLPAAMENASSCLLVGECPSMVQLRKLILCVAQSPSNIVIQGESGTGKDVVARSIHQCSSRKDRPFVAINCAAIPEALLESELFGYVRGAFSGALAEGKVGLIQAAHQGTLFLDEIGDMPLSLQAKLLRALEAREVIPVGAHHPISVDIRIISATNKDFSELLSAKKFREDLFYRLNVIPLPLPPLRDRVGDVRLLVQHFVAIHARRMGKTTPALSPETIFCLDRYLWPGNLRELSNLVEYLLNIVPEGEVITPSFLPPSFGEGRTEERRELAFYALGKRLAEGREKEDGVKQEKNDLASLEKESIKEALARAKNKTLAAKALGIGVATLYRKIRKYQMEA